MPYAIAKDGTVIRTEAGPGTHKFKVLKQFTQGEIGYGRSWSDMTVCLSYQGRREKVAVETLVALMWHGQTEGDYYRNREPYRLEPLELNRPHGEKHGMAKLTDSDILEIRRIWKSTRHKYGLVKELAERFWISRFWVYKIVRADATNGPWKHLLQEVA